MERRNFITKNLLTLSSLALFPGLKTNSAESTNSKSMLTAQESDVIAPLAITMWDFSWIERRWPGAGYEDFDKALDELVERGYNAVRIDAFPHFINVDPIKKWTLKPVWNQQDWGSPAINSIQIQPSLNMFIAACKERKIKIGLSSWYREDLDNVRMLIDTPEKMASAWISTLRSIAKEDLLDTIFYVDLCNEWPGDLWSPYFKNNPPELTWGGWNTTNSINWMKTSIELLRNEFPEIAFGYSFDSLMFKEFEEHDLSFLDYSEPHIWMAQANKGEFYNLVGYRYDRFKPDSYESLVLKGEKEYRKKPDYWNKLLVEVIQKTAKIHASKNIPLMTTECWGMVDYKDWPLLNWDWIKELCKIGTVESVKTGQWIAIATSNFCGPQFKGMWRDLEWHQELTSLIRSGKINEPIQQTTIVKRMYS